MNLFSSGKSYLGVDIGTSAVKIVELEDKGGKAKLVTYGYVEQPTDVVRSSSSEMEANIVKIIKQICSDSRTKSKKVVASLPSFSVFSSIINLPKMKRKDLEQAIKWEAKKFVPLPIEEMVLDWKIVPDNPERNTDSKKQLKDNFSHSGLKSSQGLNKKDKLSSQTSKSNSGNVIKEEKIEKNTQKNGIFNKILSSTQKHSSSANESKDENIKILLTAAPKNLVERYIKIFKSASLEILSLETESFALERALVGYDPSAVMIVDIGSVSSDMVIINNNIPMLTRSVDVGGATITKALMDNLNVDLERAEQFKRDIGFSATGKGDLPELIKESINPIINEIKYSLDIFLSQDDSQPIDKIILTGGSAWLPELSGFLAKLLDSRVIVGDPWDRVVYPLELKPVLSEIGPRFSVAIGLAMRPI